MAATKKGFVNTVSDTVNSFFMPNEEVSNTAQTTDNGQHKQIEVSSQVHEDINMSIDTYRQTPNKSYATENSQSVVEHLKRPIGPVRPEMIGERKSKRYNLLLKPSIFDGLVNVVQAEGGSVNNLINDVLEEYLDSKKNYSAVR